MNVTIYIYKNTLGTHRYLKAILSILKTLPVCSCNRYSLNGYNRTNSPRLFINFVYLRNGWSGIYQIGPSCHFNTFFNPIINDEIKNLILKVNEKSQDYRISFDRLKHDRLIDTEPLCLFDLIIQMTISKAIPIEI